SRRPTATERRRPSPRSSGSTGRRRSSTSALAACSTSSSTRRFATPAPARPKGIVARPHPHHVLVTGATGGVGRAVVAELLGAGVPVRALTREPATAGLPATVDGVGGVTGALGR